MKRLRLRIASQARPIFPTLSHSKNPAFEFCDGPFVRRQRWLKERRQIARQIGFLKPAAGGVGILLVRGPAGGRIAAAPERRIHLRDHVGARLRDPSIEGPEVDGRPKGPAQKAEPRNARMAGLGHRARHVKVKHRFRRAGSLFGEPPPARTALPSRAVAANSISHKLNVDVVLIGRPMYAEVVQESFPSTWKAVLLEIGARKRKRVVDAHQRGRLSAERRAQPFGQSPASPVPSWAWWWRHLHGRLRPAGDIGAQPLKARRRRFRSRVINPDVAREGGHFRNKGCPKYLTQIS